MLQGAFVIFTAIPLHLFQVYMTRPRDSRPFGSSWSVPTIVILAHYATQLLFCYLHYSGLLLRGGLSTADAMLLRAYRLCTKATVFFAVLVFTLMLLWLGSTMSYNQPYVIQLSSILLSFVCFVAVGISAASKFGKQCDEALTNESASPDVLTRAEAAEPKLEDDPDERQRVAAALDLSGKGLFRLFVALGFILILASIWILEGAYLWAADGVTLTSTVMPAFVLGGKVHADGVLKQIKGSVRKKTGVERAMAMHDEEMEDLLA